MCIADLRQRLLDRVVFIDIIRAVRRDAVVRFLNQFGLVAHLDHVIIGDFLGGLCDGFPGGGFGVGAGGG